MKSDYTDPAALAAALRDAADRLDTVVEPLAPLMVDLSIVTDRANDVDQMRAADVLSAVLTGRRPVPEAGPRAYYCTRRHQFADGLELSIWAVVSPDSVKNHGALR